MCSSNGSVNSPEALHPKTGVESLKKYGGRDATGYIEHDEALVELMGRRNLIKAKVVIPENDLSEMSLAEYEDFVFNAGRLNEPDPVAAWKNISVAQQKLVDFLNGKKDYRVVAANGTDVRMSVANMRWIKSQSRTALISG